MKKKTDIEVKKVSVHNLKSIDLSLKPDQLIVLTGVSGSGKSSLAFDTIYVEGQRRYVESLSHYAKRQMGELTKPEMESASGITPTISIEQKTVGKNPRSTVGTITQIHDFLRVLYARIGVPHCPVSGEKVMPQSRERIIKTVQSYPKKSKIIILSPYARGKKAEFKEDFQDLLRKGFMRVRIDGNWVDLGEEISLDGSVAHDIDLVVDRLEVTLANQSRIADSISQGLQHGDGMCLVYNQSSDEEELFSMHAFSPKSGLSYKSLEPHDFSFNSPSGMCPKCHGLGTTTEFRLDLIIDPKKSIAEDCCSVATSYQTVRYGNIYDNLARLYDFDVYAPWEMLSREAQEIFLYGTKQDKWLKMIFVHPVKGSTWIDRIKWKGVLHEAHVRYQEAKSESYKKKMAPLLHKQICQECNGARLKPYPAAATIKNKRISEISSFTIGDCHDFFASISCNNDEMLIAGELLKEIKERLQFLMEVGLHYLTLDRTSPTLSGGEAQRVRLASQIGCGLVGITYVLDEPSIGLHPRDNVRLIKTLKHLRDMGNTVLVVEHDEETILSADHIIDFGPGAGSHGGEIIVNGSLKKLLNSKKSITSQYLTGKQSIPIPKKRRSIGKNKITIEGAKHHNLKNISISFPLNVFICITGVSGSGKSSLVSDILHPALSNYLHGGEHFVGNHKRIKGTEHIDKVIGIDQSPIGRNPRSNPATYIKLFDEIRDLYAELPESKARGYKKGRFSFNVKEGSCSECVGMGLVKVDMDFMEDAWSLCTQCLGKRFDEETLSVKFKEKSIYDVLEMDIEEASIFFENIPSISHKLRVLMKVGLHYLKLGQFSTTLSGGEAERVKLAKELVRPATGNTLYILDEPTTGLHYHDIKHLLEVLHELVDRGNTVIVIEHNMDVVKTADWIIDLGPEGGGQGGEIVSKGTPEQLAKQKTPTGTAIHQVLSGFYLNEVKKIAKAPTNSKNKKTHSIQEITVKGAEQNNLKQVEAAIPRGKITICTGPSGSGKSSFAFETIYAEGQRRYIESLSPYARQFVKQMPKPIVQFVEGLSPAIAIEQKSHAGNPRSTIGTLTEVYDLLRVFWSRIGIPHCPETKEEIKAISKEFVVDRIMSFPQNKPLIILAPTEIKRGAKPLELFEKWRRLGFLRIRIDGTYYSLDEAENISIDTKRKHELCLVIDRLKTGPSIRQRVFEGIETASSIGNQKIVLSLDGEDKFYNLSFSVETTGRSYPEITPHTFAFNTPEGMCPYCEGLGYTYGANLTQNSEILVLSPIELIELLWSEWDAPLATETFLSLLEKRKIDPYLPLLEQDPNDVDFLTNGSKNDFVSHRSLGLNLYWRGLNHVIGQAVRSTDSKIKQEATFLLEEVKCHGCNGARIHALARHVTINGKGIHEICQMPIADSLAFMKSIKLDKENRKILEEVYESLLKRMEFLLEVGLDYLSLDRASPTLSGGEAQRIRLARQLGSGLTGTLYVLDEPTIGLHPKDNDQLNQALLKLKNLGNTLLLVEHDPLTIEYADYILDFGPEAGEQGGHITARGTLSKIKQNPKSLTGQYLSGKKQIPIPQKRRKAKKNKITIQNASLHNLKNIDVPIPTTMLVCVTGVSGSGKSTLIHEVLSTGMHRGIIGDYDPVSLPFGQVAGCKQFESMITIDQKPIGHTIRSNVGTYVEVLDRIRSFFSQLPTARTRGLEPRHFSYNHRKGMCSSCYGLGYKRVEMHFLPMVKVPCQDCNGLRLNPVSLEVQYRGKNFGEYLRSTVSEARIVFESHPRITRILDTLIDVGLGYLKLGQEMVSLSGGEAQRIKLSRELAKRQRGKTLYLLDEPTTGLHSDDILKLLSVLHRLVDQGNTIIVVEHNIDFIKNADYIVDLGPGAGDQGGSVICSGTPEEVIQCKASFTGKYLLPALSPLVFRK